MSEAACAWGVSVSLVSMWVSGARRIPYEKCEAIHCLTGVPLRLLRPDIFRLVKPPHAGPAFRNFMAAAARRRRRRRS